MSFVVGFLLPFWTCKHYIVQYMYNTIHPIACFFFIFIVCFFFGVYIAAGGAVGFRYVFRLVPFFFVLVRHALFIMLMLHLFLLYCHERSSYSTTLCAHTIWICCWFLAVCRFRYQWRWNVNLTSACWFFFLILPFVVYNIFRTAAAIQDFHSVVFSSYLILLCIFSFHSLFFLFFVWDRFFRFCAFIFAVYERNFHKQLRQNKKKERRRRETNTMNTPYKKYKKKIEEKHAKKWWTEYRQHKKGEKNNKKKFVKRSEKKKWRKIDWTQKRQKTDADEHSTSTYWKKETNKRQIEAWEW